MAGVEENDIRGLDIDKFLHAVTFTEYVLKAMCRQSNTKADAIRWYAKTSPTTLTATAPSTITNISPLSRFQTLETSVTRNTAYVRKYGATDFISMEDVEGADIDMLALTIAELTRAVIRQVDSRVYAVLTDSDAIPVVATGHNMIVTSGAWTDAASNPIRDILEARRVIFVSGGYTQNPTLVLNPQDYSNLCSWLIFAKGSSIPTFASEKVVNGTVMELMGTPIKISQAVTADKAVMLIPGLSVTWKSFQDTTSEVINHPGLGKEIRVWELGEAIRTDPKSVCLISNTQ
jgi:hypothetical protein